MYQYAYLIGLGLFTSMWLLIFILGKNVRRQMIIMSLLVGFLGPLSEFYYYKDYWRPEYLLPIAWGGGEV